MSHMQRLIQIVHHPKSKMQTLKILKVNIEENMVTQSEKNCFFLFLLVKEMAVPVQKLWAIEEALCAAEDV